MNMWYYEGGEGMSTSDNRHYNDYVEDNGHVVRIGQANTIDEGTRAGAAGLSKNDDDNRPATCATKHLIHGRSTGGGSLQVIIWRVLLSKK
jgi:hypothetical protein